MLLLPQGEKGTVGRLLSVDHARVRITGPLRVATRVCSY